MKFTLSWLKDHLETDATVDQITEALTDLGLEVESVNLKKGVANVKHFGPIHFRRLINTSPLNEFIARTEDAPAAVKRAAAACAAVKSRELSFRSIAFHPSDEDLSLGSPVRTREASPSALLFAA